MMKLTYAGDHSTSSQALFGSLHKFLRLDPHILTTFNNFFVCGCFIHSIAKYTVQYVGSGTHFQLLGLVISAVAINGHVLNSSIHLYTNSKEIQFMQIKNHRKLSHKIGFKFTSILQEQTSFLFTVVNVLFSEQTVVLSIRFLLSSLVLSTKFHSHFQHIIS